MLCFHTKGIWPILVYKTQILVNFDNIDFGLTLSTLNLIMQLYDKYLWPYQKLFVCR
jgi:hypothetical protein